MDDSFHLPIYNRNLTFQKIASYFSFSHRFLLFWPFILDFSSLT